MGWEPLTPILDSHAIMCTLFTQNEMYTFFVKILSKKTVFHFSPSIVTPTLNHQQCAEFEGNRFSNTKWHAASCSSSRISRTARRPRLGARTHELLLSVEAEGEVGVLRRGGRHDTRPLEGGGHRCWRSRWCECDRQRCDRRGVEQVTYNRNSDVGGEPFQLPELCVLLQYAACPIYASCVPFSDTRCASRGHFLIRSLPYILALHRFNKAQ